MKYKNSKIEINKYVDICVGNNIVLILLMVIFWVYIFFITF